MSTFTQEQVDQMIKDRVAREKEASQELKKELEDKSKQLETFTQKEKDAQFDKLISENKLELTNEQIEEFKTTFNGDANLAASAMKMLGGIKSSVKEEDPYGKTKVVPETEPKKAEATTKDDPVVKAMLSN